MVPMLKNCTDFFKTKPPVVIFFICLVFLTVTTFSFTLYIKYTDKIVNNDFKQNWISLTKHLNQLDLYFTEEKITKPYIEEISLATLISINLTDFKNITKVKAYYKLEEWQPYCPKNYIKNAQITVNFVISNDTKICALIKGPKQYLHEYIDQQCILTDLNQDDNTTLLFSHRDFSSNLTNVRLNFDGNDNLEMYLSQNEKNMIYVRLVWCTYILLLFVMILLLYGMFNRYENVGNDFDHFKLQK